MVSFKFQLN